MSHQDHGSVGFYSGSAPNHKDLFRLLSWLLQGVCFKGLRLRSDCSWAPTTLVAAGILWAWSDQQNLVDRFFQARKIINKAYRPARRPAESYQAFIKILRRHRPTLVAVLLPRLRSAMRKQLSACWTVCGRTIFVVDGSRVDLLRTVSNEKAYAKTRKRKPKSSHKGARTPSGVKRNQVPQIYMTLLWHLGSRLSWAWRTGPSNSWECEHLEEMLGEIPKGSLIVGDAKFIGYELWQKLFSEGHDVLVRVGSNVKLLKKLGFTREYDSTVYYWPKLMRYARRPPLVFRLIHITGGKKPVYLLTNLKKCELTDRQVGEIYARRWGIEVYYRSFKKTYGRRKLRSGKAENAMCELTWSLIGLWSAGLFALRHTKIEPDRLSIAQVLRAIQTTMREYRTRPEPGGDLITLTSQSEIDNYRRKNKKSRSDVIRDRNYEAKHVPNIAYPNKEEFNRANELKTELRLTA